MGEADNSMLPDQMEEKVSRFDFDKLKRRYKVRSIVSNLFVSALLSFIIIAVFEMELMVIFTIFHLWENRIASVFLGVSLILGYIIGMVLWFLRSGKKCQKSFHTFYDELSKIGKADIIINYVGKLNKRKEAKCDLRFDKLYFCKNGLLPVIKFTKEIRSVVFDTPDPKKPEIIGTVRPIDILPFSIPFYDFTIIRRWYVQVLFNDGTVVFIPAKNKKKGVILMNSLLENAFPNQSAKSVPGIQTIKTVEY